MKRALLSLGTGSEDWCIVGISSRATELHTMEFIQYYSYTRKNTYDNVKLSIFASNAKFISKILDLEFWVEKC